MKDPFNGVWLNGSLDGNTRVINLSFRVGGRDALISLDRERVVHEWCAHRLPPPPPDPDGGSRVTFLEALRKLQNGAASLATASSPLNLS